MPKLYGSFQTDSSIGSSVPDETAHLMFFKDGAVLSREILTGFWLSDFSLESN